ncbi:Gamma-aminobutyric acid type B receptor subunit 2 [Holothuria leucospilota]|uniref:Gamma-aminobutyric acid type B receptor subunit 2 n=1 Tax=Holothuria leucospilota TaxID=206669 RepID=A0A9Q1CGW4_HOLLE|nr:Gamma-aminobutyric acid type B receptor subunit 2 [Holothuria leucospilota]
MAGRITQILVLTVVAAMYSVGDMTTPGIPFGEGGTIVTQIVPTSSLEPRYFTTASSQGNYSSTPEYEVNTKTATPSTKKIPLYIAGFYSSGERWDSTGMIVAADLAVDHVNERLDILEEYELDIVWKDSMVCTSADGIWQFYQHLIEEPQKVIVLGPPCSVDAEPVAETSHNGNLVTMSYAASSPRLSNRELYPYFYRTYKTDILFNLPRVWLLNYFDWKRIGSLSENHDVFALTNNDLFELLPENDISVEVTEIFDGQVTPRQIERLKEEDVRISIVGTYENAARELFCQIYRNQLYGKGYVWILPGWYSENWWQKTSPVEGCTEEEIQIAVEESLYISMEVSNVTDNLDNETVAGITANQYKEDIVKKMKNDSYYEEIPITFSGVEPFAYDAVWAIALTLNRTVNELSKNCSCPLSELSCSCRRLEDFMYNDTELGPLIFDEMAKTAFKGVSGSISFADAYDRQGVTKIEQLQARCDEGWLLYNFSCYLFVNEQKVWNDARQHCQTLKYGKPSYLVSILSQEEFEFLQLNQSNEWFIGLKYDSSLDKFTWVDAKQSEVVWVPESFSDDSNDVKNCYVWNIDTGTWKRFDCGTPRPFICKTRTDFEERLILTIPSDGEKVGDPIWYHEFTWPDGVVPLDRTPAVEQGLTGGIYASLAFIASLGIIMALAFLTFNILARKHSFVKLSSPNLNNVIAVGCILIYVSICILGLEVVHRNKNREPQRVFCMLRIWLISVGFVLGFGALFTKTWRVYKVADLTRGARRIEITDSKLFGLIGIFLVIDVIILILWQSLDPLQHSRLDLDIGRFTFLCDCKHLTVWACMLLIYKGVILVFGVFLAWETRNVTIPALNDSKSIGICIYNTTVMSAVGVAMTLAFPDSPGLQYLTTSLAMIFCATFILLVVFVPKIIFVYKHPNADRKISTTLSPSSPATRNSSDSQETETGSGSRVERNVLAKFMRYVTTLNVSDKENSKGSANDDLPPAEVNLNGAYRKPSVAVIEMNGVQAN